MKLFRQTGAFSLVALLLAACGASAVSSIKPLDESTPPAQSTSVGPTCPTPQPDASITALCESPAELAAGQQLVHSPTIPDSAFISAGISVTISPTDTSTISEQQAMSIAEQGGGYTAHSAILGEVHDLYGNPTSGPLEWIVDVSPTTPDEPYPGRPGFYVQYAFVIINAVNGSVLGTSQIGAPASASASTG